MEVTSGRDRAGVARHGTRHPAGLRSSRSDCASLQVAVVLVWTMGSFLRPNDNALRPRMVAGAGRTQWAWNNSLHFTFPVPKIKPRKHAVSE